MIGFLTSSLSTVLWGTYNLMALWDTLSDASATTRSRLMAVAISFVSIIFFVFASVKMFLFLEAFFWVVQMLAGIIIMATAPPSGKPSSDAQSMIIGGNVRAILAVAVRLM